MVPKTLTTDNYTPFQAVWLGARDLVHGPRSEQNRPAQIELMQH